MLSEYQKRINVGVGIGLIMQLVGRIMAKENVGHSDAMILFGRIIGLLGLPIVIYGLSMYAKAKGRHWAWGFLGFLSLIGLIILYFLKDYNKEKK